MTKYHNPYHFVPVISDTRPDDLSVADFEDLNVGNVRHDCYIEKTFSGRIVCRLTTVTPIFIGASRTREATDQAPAEVAPFTVGANNSPAIPASSLRGLISSIAEAASNSALRVLENRAFSYRKAMTEKPLSAIGMVIIQDGEFFLRPLTLPTIERQGNITRLTGGFANLFPVPNLKVYIGSPASIRSANFPFNTYSLENPVFYGLKLRRRVWGLNKSIPPDPNQHFSRNNRYLLSQSPLTAGDPIRWSSIPDSEKPQYTRGILRVLGCSPERDLPNTKKHEIFIPYPVEAENWPSIPIQDIAIERFHELADERTDETATGPELLPYEPRGTKRNAAPGQKAFRIKAGDLVFFRPNDNGTEVEEISFSSIWRDRVEASWNGIFDAARAVDFFTEINRELPPFDSQRDQITIAEQIFGFVQDQKDKGQTSCLALAGRTYFSSAQMSISSGTTPFLLPITLRILGSPKPPSPAFYFKNRDGENRHIAKSELDLDLHAPQGRKFYLHHRPQDIQNEPWKTRNNERNKQKVNIKPIRPQTVFYFHVDVENLSRRELGLLLYSLKPTHEFRHKIGMGKSIGLGTINIEPVGVFRVDRQARYSSPGLFAPRYNEIWLANGEATAQWPVAYDNERSITGQPLAIEEIREEFRSSMSAAIRNALEMLGDPLLVRHRVVTPLVSVNNHEADSEKETFRWFVANDQGSGRAPNRINARKTCLPPISEETEEIPTLPSLPWAG